MRNNLFKLALEDFADGKAHAEIELVFYVKVKNWKQFEALAAVHPVEHHRQLEIRVEETDKNKAGRFRVREIEKSGNREYHLTSKLKREGGGSDEVTVETSLDQFQHFAVMSANGMHKTRITVPNNAGKSSWELDLYFQRHDTNEPTGSFEEIYHPWIKVDYELQEGETGVARMRDGKGTPAFPFDVEDFIEGGNKERDPEVRDLYDRYFMVPGHLLSR